MDRLGLTHVTVGSDFCFGKGRKGTASDLQTFGAQMGFGVTIADLVETDGVHVSSTRIRQALSNGRPEDAATMLGHLHRIEGESRRLTGTAEAQYEGWRKLLKDIYQIETGFSEDIDVGVPARSAQVDSGS